MLAAGIKCDTGRNVLKPFASDHGSPLFLASFWTIPPLSRSCQPLLPQGWEGGGTFPRSHIDGHSPALDGGAHGVVRLHGLVDGGADDGGELDFVVQPRAARTEHLGRRRRLQDRRRRLEEVERLPRPPAAQLEYVVRVVAADAGDRARARETAEWGGH